MLRSKYNTIEPIQYMPALNRGRLFICQNSCEGKDGRDVPVKMAS